MSVSAAPTGGSSELPRTLVGVLSSRDDGPTHTALVGLLERLAGKDYDHIFPRFGFVFTGGTYDRLFEDGVLPSGTGTKVKNRAAYQTNTLRLPPFSEGGVILLAQLVVERRISVVWPFLSPQTSHWLHADNAAFLRLCDHWRVNRLLNPFSVQQWIDQGGALAQLHRNPQDWPLTQLDVGSVDAKYASLGDPAVAPPGEAKFPIPRTPPYHFDLPSQVSEGKRKAPNLRLALIAHDEMKDRMLTFVSDYQSELKRNFARIITTGTTGSQIRDAVEPLSSRIHRYHSGPKGGDIQIATEILLGLIDAVIFFVDPLHPHPHIDDIRALVGACIMRPVRMLTNERQAREWIENELQPRRS